MPPRCLGAQFVKRHIRERYDSGYLSVFFTGRRLNKNSIRRLIAMQAQSDHSSEAVGASGGQESSMKQILVAVDLLPSSDRAFDRAVRLAAEHKAELTLVHVIREQMLEYDGYSSRREAVLRKRAEEKLSRLWSELPAVVAGRFRYTTKIGTPWEEILGAATQSAADLIILGLHRANTFKDLFIGTTAERIVRTSVIPTLVVKDRPFGAYGKVISTTNFSSCSSRALQSALDLAPSADFELLHVFDTPFSGFMRFTESELEAYTQKRIDEAENQIKLDVDLFLKSRVGITRPVVSVFCTRGEVTGGIASTVLDHKADLLALGIRSRSAIIGSILGSVATTFLTDPPCDLLVVP